MKPKFKLQMVVIDKFPFLVMRRGKPALAAKYCDSAERRFLDFTLDSGKVGANNAKPLGT
ncbi:MAG: hypothetical protein DMG40_11425 [Acidobacteria bacterium]|nr:MAG: hypothetical protein DMG40_11425 [Acidobacteriota bacterium]